MTYTVSSGTLNPSIPYRIPYPRGIQDYGNKIYISILTVIFPGEPGLRGFIGAKDDGSDGDNWNDKMCKAPVKFHY